MSWRASYTCSELKLLVGAIKNVPVVERAHVGDGGSVRRVRILRCAVCTCNAASNSFCRAVSDINAVCVGNSENVDAISISTSSSQLAFMQRPGQAAKKVCAVSRAVKDLHATEDGAVREPLVNSSRHLRSTQD